jgi:Secreted and surface protein containing fasciclin-like repeats
LGGKDIRKSGILVVLLLAIVFISGCAENARDNNTEHGEEEKVTPVQGTTPNITENVTESAGKDVEEESVSGQEATSSDEGKEVIIPGEEKSKQANKSSSESQTLESNQTIVQTMEGAGYTTFASLMRDAGLEDTFNKGGPYTIFAPTDIAFESLPEDMLDNLRNDKERLNRVLTYHIVNGEYKASALKNISSLTSMETEKIAVNTTTDGQIMVGNATITEPDTVAGNGIIHGINEVLIPP